MQPPATTSAPLTRRFTIDEYHRMGAAGILREDERVELIRGAVVQMSPIGARHAACVARTSKAFILQAGDQAVVWVQNPIRIPPDGEPEPALALLRLRPDDYAAELPGPDDMLLVIEIADGSLGYDRETKLSLYAEAGIPEAWLADLQHDRVETHREPDGTRYRRREVFVRGDTLHPILLPDVAIAVESILGQTTMGSSRRG